MASVNKVILIGNLTREPEIRQTQAGGLAASFSLAINRRSTSASGEIREETTFVDCTVFNRLAEVVRDYVHKGDPLFVEGRLHQDTWDDKQTGQKRSRLVVYVDNLQLLTRRSDAQQGGGYGAPQQGGYGAPQQGYGQTMTVGYGVPQQQGGGYRQPPPQYGSAAPMPPPPQPPRYQQGPAAAAPAAPQPMPSFQQSAPSAAPAASAPLAADDVPVDDVPF